MSQNPFRFGTPLDQKEILGREEEIQRILECFHATKNLVLLAPRGIGKSSLLHAVMDKLNEEKVQTIYVDLFPAINSRRFAEIYASALTLDPSQTIETMRLAVQALVPTMSPRVTINGNGKPGLQLDLWDWDRDLRNMLEKIVDAPAQMTKTSGEPLLVVFDDFEDLVASVEKKVLASLATAVRKHKNVVYIFVLRKESTARAIFDEAKSPFYRLAEGFLLEPVRDSDLVRGLNDMFQKAGVEVAAELLFQVVDLADKSSHYVQMLCHSIYEETREKGSVNAADLANATSHVLDAGAYGFKNMWDHLAPHQRNLVLAIAQGYNERLHSQRMVFQLGLGSPSTVSKNLKVLSEREVLQKREGKIHFVDPFFGLWLKRRMT